MAVPAIPQLDAPALVRYGLPELVEGVAPAAATDFAATIDGAFLQRLVSVYATLTTDANVADRYVSLEYRDAAGNPYCVSGAPVAVTASSTQPFAFSAFQVESAWPVGGTVLSPLSAILLPPTHSWRIVLTGEQAADALSGIRYVRERYYTTHQPSTDIPYPA